MPARACTPAAALLAAAAAFAQSSQPPLPPADPPAGCLPRIVRPFAADGELTEWDDAASLPMRSATRICGRRPGHAWRGPADASAELLLAWDDEGLCAAAVVADDDVRNDRDDAVSWQQDCVEFFVDGRTNAAAFLTKPYRAGVYQILVRPPLPGRPAALVPMQPNAALRDAPVAGRRIPTGYVVEFRVPWAVFHGFRPRPGAALGIQAGLDDADGRDGNDPQPLLMTGRGAANLHADPSRFLRFALAEALPRMAAPLDGLADFDAPAALGSRSAAELRVDCGRTLSVRAAGGRARLRLLSPSGDIRADLTLPLQPQPDPWAQAVAATGGVSMVGLEDGVWILQTEVFDAAGGCLAKGACAVPSFSGTLGAGRAGLERIDLPALAATNAGRACQALAVGAAMDRLRVAVAAGRVPEALRVRCELKARLARWEGRAPGPDATGGLVDLLEIEEESDGEATVALDADADRAHVLFRCGAVPLAAAGIEDLGDPGLVAQAMPDAVAGGFARGVTESCTAAGRPGCWTCQRLFVTAFDPAAFAPDRQVAVAAAGRGLLLNAAPLADLDRLRPRCAAVLDGCPATVRQAVEAWAARGAVPLVRASAAATNLPALLAGDPRGPWLDGGSNVLAAAHWNRLWIEPAPGSLTVADGTRIVRIEALDRNTALRAAEAVVSGAPRAGSCGVLRAAILARRSATAAGVAPCPLADLWIGDTHMHTFYSDGRLPPVSLGLRAILSGLEFAVLTDHNTIEGARVQQRLFRDAGFDFPFVVGQEITSPLGYHLNAYPLSSLVAWTNSASQAAAEAHAQGAVVQWNHPGYPGGEWDSRQQLRGLMGTGIDAWEHYSPLLDAWPAEIERPATVGTSDTHAGTFENLERTLVQSTGMDGARLAAAVRRRDIAMLSFADPRVLRGSPAVTAALTDALRDPAALRAAWQARLRRALARADLARLVLTAPERAVAADELAVPR